ncbi:MAG: hypothetical protein E3K32_13620 [wastewater metagenome]|nr:hypothetical protein [Candidatus Loosdrechtia aerotolerans]
MIITRAKNREILTKVEDTKMSWVCPYQIKNECLRLRKICQPSQDGCVLKGNVTFIEYQGESKQNNNVKSDHRVRRRSQRGKTIPEK